MSSYFTAILVLLAARSAYPAPRERGTPPAVPPADEFLQTHEAGSRRTRPVAIILDEGYPKAGSQQTGRTAAKFYRRGWRTAPEARLAVSMRRPWNRYPRA